MRRDLATANRLTPREEEAVRFVAQGMNNADIGVAMGIGTETVKRHLANVFDKVGCSTRLELAVWSVNDPDERRTQWLEAQMHMLQTEPNKSDIVCGRAFIESMSSKL